MFPIGALGVIACAWACACGRSSSQDQAPPAAAQRTATNRDAAIAAGLPVTCDQLLTAGDVQMLCGAGVELAPDSPHDDLGPDRSCMRVLRSAHGGWITIGAWLHRTTDVAAAAYRASASAVLTPIAEWHDVGDHARQAIFQPIGGVPSQGVDVARGRITVHVSLRGDPPPCHADDMHELARVIAARLPGLPDEPPSEPPSESRDAGAIAGPQVMEKLVDCLAILAPGDIERACGGPAVAFDRDERLERLSRYLQRVASGPEQGAFAGPTCMAFYTSKRGRASLAVAWSPTPTPRDELHAPERPPDRPGTLKLEGRKGNLTFELEVAGRDAAWCSAAGIQQLGARTLAKLPSVR
ncbi:MAG: hypothetical protein H6Q90_4198 [Deltaproteobacteria bacterium]|nr:hypothetical protein [Deltaproteobacteria bacterium]